MHIPLSVGKHLGAGVYYLLAQLRAKERIHGKCFYSYLNDMHFKKI